MDRAKSYYEVSNFGNETKLGSSKFQQSNEQTSVQGQQNTSTTMSKVRQAYSHSNFGTGKLVDIAA